MIETVNDVIPIGVRDTYPYSICAINFIDIETGEDNVVHIDMDDNNSTDVVPLNNKYFKITFYDFTLIKSVKKFLKIQDGKIINIVLDFDRDNIIDIFSTKYDDTFLAIGYDPSLRKYHIYKMFVYPDGSFKKEEYAEKYLGEYLFPDPTAQTFDQEEWSVERGYQPSVPGGIVLYCADKDILYVSNTNYIYAVSGIVDDKPSILYKRKINKLTSIERTYATGELRLRQNDHARAVAGVTGNVVLLSPDGEPLYSHHCDKRFLLVGNNNFILSKGSVYSIKERKIVSKYYDFLISTDIISYGGSMPEYNSYISGEWSDTPSYKITTTRYRTDYFICIEHGDDNNDYITIYDFRFNKPTKKSFIFPKDKYFEKHTAEEDKYDVFMSMNFFTERWGLCELRQSTDCGYITSIINTKGEIILIDGKVTSINGSIKPFALVDNDYSDIAFAILNYSSFGEGSIAFFNYKGEKLYIVDSLFQEIKEYLNSDDQYRYDWTNSLSTSFSNYDFNIFKGDNLFIRILDKTDKKSFHVLYDLKENRIKRIITNE